MYILDKKLLFIHIPKTAGTALARAFGIVSHPHLSYRQSIDFYKIDDAADVYTFAFIRDPGDRFVSTFKQLLGRSRKRSFDKFKTFNPEQFQLWVKSVWFPHYAGRKIDIKDQRMQDWVTREMSTDKPHGFNPDSYQIWLENNDNNFKNINLMLDFRFPVSEIKLLTAERNKFFTLDEREEISIEGLREYNSSGYGDFWDKESTEMFNSLAKEDINFYNKFLKQRYTNEKKYR